MMGKNEVKWRARERELINTITEWKDEVLRLREQIKNKDERIAMLQKMVNSYQADNERDYSAHD